MNSTMDEIGIAFNFPGDKIDVAVSDVINGLRDEGASISTEVLTKILGNRIVKQLNMYLNILFFIQFQKNGD